MLIDFQNSFIDRFITKFATKPSLTIPPTLNVSLHYLVKYQCSKNCHVQDLSEASCHARFRRCWKNSLQWF